MTSLGVRRLYFDDDKGDLHVFDGKDAFWRWYGAPNQYRDPLQTPRVWSKEARTRIAKAVGLPAVSACRSPSSDWTGSSPPGSANP